MEKYWEDQDRFQVTGADINEIINIVIKEIREAWSWGEALDIEIMRLRISRILNG